MPSQPTCPHCRGGILPEPSLAGKFVECPHCGGPFQMPQVAQPTRSAPKPDTVQIQVSSETRRDSNTGPLVLKGRQGKTVSVQGETVKIVKEGWILGSKREKAIPIRNVSSVEVKKPGSLAVGFIQFSIAGGAVRDSSYKWTGGAFDAVQDENSVVFAGKYAYQIALRIKDYVENYREGSASDDGHGVSIADEIMKLKTLVDQGIITAEQFEAKKRQLLGI